MTRPRGQDGLAQPSALTTDAAVLFILDSGRLPLIDLDRYFQNYRIIMTEISRTRVVLSLGTAQTLAWGSTYYLPAILAPPMARDLALSLPMVFGAFSAALALAALFGPLAGRWIDLAGGRAALVLSNLTFAAGLVLLAAAHGPVLLYGGWLVIGAGMALGLYEAAFATLAGLYGTAARGPITGITLIAGFASTVCWPISGALEAELGWRTTCLVWAAAQVVIGVPLNGLMLPAGRNSQPAPAPPAAGAAGGHRRAMLLLAILFAVTWFISTAMAAHLPRLLQAAGASAAAAIAAAALIGPAQVAARVVEFGLLRHCHPLLSARLAAAAHPVGALAVLLLGAPAGLFFAVMHGAGNGILTIAKGTLPLALFGAAGYGLRQGLLMVPARFAQAAAPLAFALAIDCFGTAALGLSAGLGLAGLAALLLLRTPRGT